MTLFVLLCSEHGKCVNTGEWLQNFAVECSKLHHVNCSVFDCRYIWLKHFAQWRSGRLFVKRFTLCYQTVVCLSCPVCDVRALWPNGWTDQDETWHAGRSRPWPHCVRWGPSSPSSKGAQLPPNFRPISVRPYGCMDQEATWYGARPQPRRLCVRWGPRSTLPKTR